MGRRDPERRELTDCRRQRLGRKVSDKLADSLGPLCCVHEWCSVRAVCSSVVLLGVLVNCVSDRRKQRGREPEKTKGGVGSRITLNSTPDPSFSRLPEGRWPAWNEFPWA